MRRTVLGLAVAVLALALVLAVALRPDGDSTGTTAGPAGPENTPGPTQSSPGVTVPPVTPTRPPTGSAAPGNSSTGAVPVQPEPDTSSAAVPLREDMRSWPAQRLAAQLIVSCADMSDAAAIRRAARAGVAGVTLFGSPTKRLAADLRSARRLAPHEPPIFASDEEGGAVQRLKRLLGPLPSAETMGRWSDARIESTAYTYGKGMRRLGITMAFAPVADLAVRGSYVAKLHRAFSADPKRAGDAVAAWQAGLRRAGVMAVVKHWPGHGSAANTHTGPATTPSLATLRRRDLVPFRRAFAAGMPAVMVGHLRVPGLTETGRSASSSPAALALLRKEAGARPLVITDDLAMAAASRSAGLTTTQAAVRSLRAGADTALACGVPVSQVVTAVRKAIESGALPRRQAEASVRRMLAVKAIATPDE